MSLASAPTNGGGGSLELKKLSTLLEYVVVVRWDEERDIVSMVLLLDCNVDEVNVVIVWSSVCREETEYSESGDSGVA